MVLEILPGLLFQLLPLRRIGFRVGQHLRVHRFQELAQPKNRCFLFHWLLWRRRIDGLIRRDFLLRLIFAVIARPAVARRLLIGHLLVLTLRLAVALVRRRLRDYP